MAASSAHSGQGLNICQPCSSRGNTLEADGYCRNCDEFLCKECYRVHTIPTVLHHHILLNKKEMMARKRSNKTKKEDIIDNCEMHTDKHLEYFCDVHKELACHKCLKLDHKSCKGVKHIPAVSKDIQDTAEAKLWIAALAALEERSLGMISQVQRSKFEVEKCFSVAVESVRYLKKHVNYIVDELAKSIIEEAEKISREDIDKLRSVSDNCNAVLKEIGVMKHYFETLSNSKKNCQLFIALMKSKGALDDFEKSLNGVQCENKVRHYSFKTNILVQELFRNSGRLGKLCLDSEGSKTSASTTDEIGKDYIDMNQSSVQDRNTADEVKDLTKDNLSNETASDGTASDYLTPVIGDEGNTGKDVIRDERKTENSQNKTEDSDYLTPVKCNPPKGFGNHNKSESSSASNPPQDRKGSSLQLKLVQKEDAYLNVAQEYVNTDFTATADDNEYVNLVIDAGVRGVVNRPSKTYKAQKFAEVSIHSVHDKNRFWITGAVSAGEAVVLTDYCNQNIKLLDAVHLKMISVGKLTSGPWDVTHTSEGMLVVTLPDEKKLIFFKLENMKLTKEKEVVVSGKCHGIVSTQNTLIVTYVDPVKVEVLNIHGYAVLQVFSKDKNGQNLFMYPRHVAVSQDSKILYVSDSMQDSVVSLSLVDGSVKGVYKSPDLKDPGKVVVASNGHVYVCGKFSNNIHRMTSTCDKLNMLLTSADGLNFPFTLCWCEKESKMYVAMENSSRLKIYRISYQK